MKKLLPLFLVFFILVNTIEIKAQTTQPYYKKWLFGMNWGGAWEHADVHSRLGTGLGLTLEREVIANNTSVFGFSLRGRYLHTWMWGRESTPFYGIGNDDNLNGTNNPSINYLADGYVYRNFYTKTDEFSLEGLLILNKLRAHSGFKIYGFGGIGATGYTSKINQLNGSNTTYDYSSVSTFSKQLTRNDLNNLWDNTYETNTGRSRNSYGLSGSIGIGVGIKLSPNVYLGWEHKYTYTSTDMLDGSKWTNDNTLSLKNDRYHYSSLFVTVAIGSGTVTTQPVQNQTTYYPPPAQQLPKPVITQLYPHENPAFIPDCNPEIKLSITNVASSNQITVLKDGNILSGSYYSFDPVTEVLTIRTPIAGNTIFSVIAENITGKDTKYVYTNCTPVTNVPTPVYPVITIVSSNGNNCMANVLANVRNVTNAGSVQVIMDGVILSSQQYTFNIYNGSIVINTPFNQFTTITIRALNNGNAVAQSVNLSCNSSPVVLPPTQQIPIINVTNSTADNSSGACIARINAVISGITSANNIQVTDNGILLNPSSYTFDPYTGALVLSHSITGAGSFLIKAQNVAGTATSTVHLNCITPTQVVLPSVTLIHPSTNTYTSNSCNENIAVKVSNVPGVQNIDVRINGLSLNKTLLHYDPSTSILRFDTKITDQTIIVVYASTSAGNASQTLIINCNPIPAPTIQIISPVADPFVSSICNETITALVTEVASISSIRVTLNDVLLTAGITYDATTDKLVIPVSFSGRSELKINASGKGGVVSESITLICQSAPKPLITLVAPAANPFVSATCQEQVIAQIQYIASAASITATINNIPVANNVMNYDAAKGVLVFPVQFTGIAAVTIKATNAIGTTTQTLSLECKPLVLPRPEIQVIAPVSMHSISKTCFEAVKMKLTNCASIADISVSVNNQLLSADKIVFDAGTGIIIFQVPVTGLTAIVVTAKNTGGIASATITIQCQPTVHPSVSILSPIGSPVISAACSENIRAVVTNVSDINQIEVTYNAISIDRSLLTYDTTSNVLSFRQTFAVNGDLIIKASNEAGNDAKTISLQCKPVLKPEIIVINPTSEPWASETCMDTIIFVAKNIESVDGITAFANNIALSGSSISFDQESGIASVRISFNSAREIKLIATNAAGSVSKTIHVTCSPVLQPTITLTNPVAEHYTSTTCQENVLMTLTNIASISQIQVKSNGIVVSPSAYTYDVSAGLLTIPTAISTVTTLEVVVTNKTKAASRTVAITCNKLLLPVVSITSPVTETAVLNNCQTILKATVDNVSSAEQLAILVNGKTISASDYTFAGNALSLPLNVTDQSVVLITATNATGTASDQVTLICNVSQVVTGPTGNTCSAGLSNPITNCTTCNTTIDVTGGDISVDVNKKVCITNTFNGNVMMNGGQLVICGNATIHTINFNSGDIVITGTASFDNINMNNSLSAIRNYGTVQFSNITFNGRFENHGQATVRSDFNVNSSASFINTGTMNATMNFNNNNFVCNSGTIIIGGNFKDNGSATFTNSCKLVVNGQINVDHDFTNNGSVSAGSITYLNGSGRLTLGGNSKWITDGLILNGTVTGPTDNCSSISVSNQTTINSSASLSGKIDICDVNGIELKSGSISNTVTDNCSCTINISGSCGLNDDLSQQVTICHNPAGSTVVPQTITISRSALSAHLAHGDHIGACTAADKPVVDGNPQVITPVVIPPVTGTQPVEEENIIICHKSSDNSGNVETITVSKSALSAHLSHGDHIGACVDTDNPVQQRPQTPVVVPPVTQPVEEQQIAICHKPYGSSIVQTITIPRSQLSAHLAHGDHVGECTGADNPVQQTPQTPVVVPPVTQPVEQQITICHKPYGSSIVQTITIPKSQLSSHLAHGDHIGACVDADNPAQQKPQTPVVVPPVTQPVEEQQVTICHKPSGSSIVQTITISRSEVSSHLAHGDHIGACVDADNTVQQTPQTPVVVPPVTQPVEQQITICHKPYGSSIVQTITIHRSQLSAHLAHGDHVGACIDADNPVQQTPQTPVVVPPVTQPVEEQQMTICHKPYGSSIVQTITIPRSQLSAHLAHGDHVGECTGADNPVQQTPQTPVVVPPVTQPVEEQKITICHKPYGSSIVQTITIPRSQLGAHLAHGDHEGVCTGADNPVQQKPQTPVVVPPVTQPVEEQRITICHKPTGSSIVQTITIPRSQLDTHLAHGDHEGACTDADRPVQQTPQTPTPTPQQTENMVTICHKQDDGQMQTITIPQSQLQSHMAHGDHVGVCRPEEMGQ